MKKYTVVIYHEYRGTVWSSMTVEAENNIKAAIAFAQSVVPDGWDECCVCVLSAPSDGSFEEPLSEHNGEALGVYVSDLYELEDKHGRTPAVG